MKTTFDTPATRHTLAFTLLVATILTLVLTFELLAQGFGPPPGGGGNSDNDRGDRPQGPPSANVMAGQLLQEFDTDGDQALSLTELTAALEALHQRRPQGGPPRGDGNNNSRPAN
jgi:hypothetical protein